MDNISPLAKTLAEANGIDWKQLQGSGEGGQIVEQDVINYLTRLMTGDEAIPENPVDAPPPDWTGDELPAGMSAEMLSQAGVESDIAAAVEQGGFKPEVPQTPSAAATPAPEPAPAATPAPEPAAQAERIEEDEFELEPQTEAAQPAAPAQPAPAQPAAATGGGLGGLLSQLYKPQGQAAAQPTPAQPEPVQPELTGPTPAAAPEPQPQAPAEATQPPTPVATPVEPEPTSVQPAAQVPIPTEPVAAERTATVPAPAPAQPPAPAPAPAAEASPVVVAATGGERPAEAVWLGVYLRRDTDLSAASDLREQLNAALGQDVPLSLLVARAAQQHIDKLGLSSVAIHDAYGDRARAIGPAGSSLRDALKAIDTDHQGEPDLQVVNAGTFDLDELHYPETITLSVGRLAEGGMAALTLNGEVESTQAAEFLAAVSESLEAPVALII